MDHHTIEQVVKQAKTAWEQGNAQLFVELFAPDGELVVPGQRWQGSDGIRQAMEAFTQSGAQVAVTIQRIMPTREGAVVEWVWHETDAETGQHHTAEDAIVIDFKDGYIQRWREYIDSQTPSA